VILTIAETTGSDTGADSSINSRSSSRSSKNSRRRIQYVIQYRGSQTTSIQKRDGKSWRFYHSILEDKNKKNISGRTNSMNIIICIEKIGRCMEEEFVGEFRIRISRTWVNRRILFRTKEFGEGNKKIGQSSRTQKDGAERRDDRKFV